ncbi:hypothetical protein OO013_16190 [Mangrovivirga sp. M17]|uniref:Uncharacterized protein n=1 Tax=Mangrovivirga halotolerans TaxID=2993936 RepID=A0ABT3RW84_9BACT|nr:hypothetical protein [Mangrovivirga halotolerans]MCX2745420.1 hypothetical protein [Mangrovivirga halotolerans]
MKELEKIQIFADGKTIPKIDSGSPILLIQNGSVHVGKINLGESYEFNMEIEHPTNKKVLDPMATKLIEKKRPEYLNSDKSIITLCPNEISDLMKFS